MMRPFHTGHGVIIHLPDVQQRATQGEGWERYSCDCHRRMGNDFWFLPKASCLRPDKTCNKTATQAEVSS